MVSSPKHSFSPIEEDLHKNETNENEPEKHNGKPGESAEAKPEDDRIPKIQFKCSGCGMNEMVHFVGKAPKFINGIEFLEETYIMLDPFQPPMPRGKIKPEYFIAIGSKCSQCGKLVCKDNDCSFFYTKTFCLVCSEKEVKTFPVEAQVRLRKQMANKNKK